MYKRYRVMITGEDTVTFCFTNNITEDQVDFSMEQARQNYPDAHSIFIEDEGIDTNSTWHDERAEDNEMYWGGLA